ncbi:MAG TPA: alcohol dehydrogenase catalytic domain-containing protein [Acidimicrobiia bacterium]|nr:alcohol dehydrogenase catalytic domain-containing protein [Acidimicrobiia bacterium]
MAGTVRAGVFTGDGSWDVRDLPEPTPPVDGAVLRVEAVGLCGSDLGQLHGGVGVPGETFPVVPGHEIVGRIEAITSGARRAWGLDEGDRVCVDEILRCGRCAACRSGDPDCTSMQVYGYTLGLDRDSGCWGGYAEKMALLPRTNLHRVPDDVPAAELTMFEPMANAVHWVARAGVALGDTVVVEGPGHQGLACAVAARAAGATTVIVTGTGADGARFEAARALGADATIDVESEDAVARVGELTGGRMADVVMDVAAVATSTIPLAVAMVKTRGTVLLAGLKHFEPVEGLITDLVVLRQLTLVGGAGFTPASMTVAVHLLAADRFDRSALVGDVVTLDTLDEGIGLLARAIPGRDSVHVSLVHGT